MTTPPEASAVPRAPLSRDRILDAALTLADRDGIAALSMRRLGQALGVEAMSLYNHVANKDDILNGIVDRVFSAIGLPAVATDWRTAMRQRGIAARAVLVRHPWALELMESRRQPDLATLRHHDAVLGCLRRAGFSLTMAAHAYSVLDSYIYGFALQQRTLPFEAGDDVAALATDMLRQFPAAEFPHLAEMITSQALAPGYDYADEFAFGLDLILDGLERYRGPE